MKLNRPKLPDHPIKFEGHTPDSWVRVLRFDYPAKGEYFISGDPVDAYQAPNAIPSKYWIVEPIPQQPTPVLHENTRSIHGDFDDMGCSRIAGGYHHDQKRARGRF